MAKRTKIDLFKDKLLELGFEIDDDAKTSDEYEFVVKKYFDRIYRGYGVPMKYGIGNEHVKYLDETSKLTQHYSIEDSCSIVSPNVAEFLVHPHGRLSSFIIAETLHSKEQITFGENADEMTAILGKASNDFIGFFRFNVEFVEYLTDLSPAHKITVSDFSTFYERPLTIRIVNKKGGDPLTVSNSISIADTCLFHIASVSHLSLKIANKWEFKGDRIIYSQGGVEPPEKLDFPKSITNRELTNYYILALNGSSPEYQYLSFYHCMEYFFLKISDQDLYDKIRSYLISPSFNVSDANIDKIVFEVQSHRHEEDEKSMLSRVLKHFVNKNELKRFLENYENVFGEKIFTSKRDILGKELVIEPLNNNLFDNLAQRIKHIRNEIVHSVDRRQRSKRRWMKIEDIAATELPLMRFLADQIIVATSEPIE